MYATKEAIIAKEHEKELQPTIFFIDIRAYGKGFDSYYERARKEYGIRYVRCMASRVAEDPQTHNLRISYQDESGEIREEEFDLVVLSVGMVPGVLHEESGSDRRDRSRCLRVCQDGPFHSPGHLAPRGLCLRGLSRSEGHSRDRGPGERGGRGGLRHPVRGRAAPR